MNSHSVYEGEFLLRWLYVSQWQSNLYAPYSLLLHKHFTFVFSHCSFNTEVFVLLSCQYVLWAVLYPTHPNHRWEWRCTSLSHRPGSCMWDPTAVWYRLPQPSVRSTLHVRTACWQGTPTVLGTQWKTTVSACSRSQTTPDSKSRQEQAWKSPHCKIILFPFCVSNPMCRTCSMHGFLLSIFVLQGFYTEPERWCRSMSERYYWANVIKNKGDLMQVN